MLEPQSRWLGVERSTAAISCELAQRATRSERARLPDLNHSDGHSTRRRLHET